MSWQRMGLLALLLSIGLAACAPMAPVPTSASEVPQPAAFTPTAARTQAAPTPSPSSTASQAPTASPEPTAPPPPAFAICSPLAEISLEELNAPDLLKSPFEQPRPGMDDGHHGADFAYWSRGERATMQGHPVQSVLSGVVAGVLPVRPPYGNAILIETRLEQIPPAWLEAMQAPTPAPTVPPLPNLYCPGPLEVAETGGTRSLYLLYAHLNQPPTLETGQPVTCGQAIGEVGTTGSSINYHLHLETRLGPPGITLNEMAHYDNAASETEMRNYCAWRVSGLFQMFDPIRLLSLQP